MSAEKRWFIFILYLEKDRDGTRGSRASEKLKKFLEECSLPANRAGNEDGDGEVEWQYAILDEKELWAVPTHGNDRDSLVEGFDAVKLADLPEAVVDGDHIIPSNWQSSDVGHADYRTESALLFLSEVSELLSDFIKKHST